MQELTLDVILRAVFGTSDERLAADIRATLAVARSLPRAAAMALAQRDLGPRSPWGAFLRRMAVVDEQLMALIARRRAAGAGGDDVLGQLLSAGLDDAELRDHLVTLLAAGHETTAGSLAWALERLARAPAVLARVRDGDEAWIDGVVKETMRIRPVLTVAPRKLAAPLRVDGLQLPAGVHVAPCIYLVHRREDLYPEARAWRPERWIGAGRAGGPELFAWIPFGGGVRRCLGAAFATMEMAEVLRVVAQRFALAPVQARGERMRRRGITLQPGRGGRVVLSDADAASSS
jgi:cytochrome P450